MNGLEKAYDKAAAPKDQIKLQSALTFNDGEHINHALFWKSLAPQYQGGGDLKSGLLKDGTVADFGSVDGECWSAASACIVPRTVPASRSPVTWASEWLSLAARWMTFFD